MHPVFSRHTAGNRKEVLDMALGGSCENRKRIEVFQVWWRNSEQCPVVGKRGRTNPGRSGACGTQPVKLQPSWPRRGGAGWQSVLILLSESSHEGRNMIRLRLWTSGVKDIFWAHCGDRAGVS